MSNKYALSRLSSLLFVFLCLLCAAEPAGAQSFPPAKTPQTFENNKEFGGIWGSSPSNKSRQQQDQDQPTTGTDPTPTYPGTQGSQVGGATAGNAQLNVTAPAPASQAQDQKPNQNLTKENLFKTCNEGYTVCSDKSKNHQGKPKPGDLPFKYYLPFAFKEGDKCNMNASTFSNSSFCTGAPPSDLVSAMSKGLRAKQLADQLNSPDFNQSQAEQQGQAQQAGEAVNNAGNNQFASNLNVCQTSLINVANENAGAPGGGSGPKTLPQAIGMVQQMYKNVYLPIALLLLLPGAVATQVMCVVHKGMRLDDSEEISSPFTGLLRAMVAVFLIPATQLIVSYGIDIGNSMTGVITDNLSTAGIVSWVSGLVVPDPNQTPKAKAQALEDQTTVGAVQDMVFGTVSMLASDGLMILTQWQIILACYLLLLGPIAACFFAWPAKVGKLFKPVFSNWLDALLNLVLWRFWWCVILLCMATRLQWLQDMGEPINTPWERLVFMSFQVMLTYVPFMALEFKPGALVDQLMEKTKGGGGGKQGSGGAAKTGSPHNRGLHTKGSVT